MLLSQLGFSRGTPFWSALDFWKIMFEKSSLKNQNWKIKFEKSSLKNQVWKIKLDKLEFWSFSNLNFAGYTGSKNQLCPKCIEVALTLFEYSSIVIVRFSFFAYWGKMLCFNWWQKAEMFFYTALRSLYCPPDLNSCHHWQRLAFLNNSYQFNFDFFF
jgi:hypothetical protein